MTRGAPQVRMVDTKTENGVSYPATVTAEEVGSETTIFYVQEMAGYGDDYFNDIYYLQIVSTTDGAAPIHEIRQILDYVSTTGRFTVANPFTANVNVNDTLIICHESIIPTILNIQDDITAIIAETEVTQASGDVTLTLAATEYDIISLNSATLAYRGKLKLYFPTTGTYTIHKYEEVNGVEREQPTVTVDATGGAQSRVYVFDWTEDVRYTVEHTIGALDVSYTVNYEKKTVDSP